MATQNKVTNTTAYQSSLSIDAQLKTLKEAKGGTWYDGWKPYCLVDTCMDSRLTRMCPMPYGFRCSFCGNMIGFDLIRLVESSLNKK